jgi:hypothetical protein
MRKAGMLRTILIELRVAEEESEKRFKASKPGTTAAAAAMGSRDAYADAIAIIQRTQRETNKRGT